MTELTVGLMVVLLVNLVTEGGCIRCYECVARLTAGDTSPCLSGDQAQLRRVHCIGPSVCAAYHYQTVVPGAPSVHHMTRGCQALRYGATCEDIFNQLRERNEILPGQHTCTTCSTDLCNGAARPHDAAAAAAALALLALSVLALP